MGGERDLHILVDIEPFGMMVELLGDERGPRHEAEGRVEIAEDEFLGDRVTTHDLAPTGEPRERRLARLTGQLLSHDGCLTVVNPYDCATDRAAPATRKALRRSLPIGHRA